MWLSHDSSPMCLHWRGDKLLKDFPIPLVGFAAKYLSKLGRRGSELSLHISRSLIISEVSTL